MNKNIEPCAELMIKKELTLAFAESATAGRLSADFSLAESAGKFLKGGIVCYDACLKEDILQVPKHLIEQYTPESAEVTEAIARGLSEVIDSDISIGVTGLTCPGGSETAEKPVGTMFICGIRGEEVIIRDSVVFHGSPEEIVVQAVSHTANLLRLYLLKNPTIPCTKHGNG